MKDRTHHIQQEKLRKLLSQKAQILYEEAIATGGKVNESQLHELERMERLAKVGANASPPPRRMQWPFVLIFIATLLTVTILLFVRVSKTDIELNLLVSGTNFRLPKQQVLTDLMRLSSLGVSGLKEIGLPRSVNKNAQNYFATDGSSTSIELSASDSLQQKGTLTLGTIALPANSFIWLRTDEIPQQFSLTVRNPDLTLHADVNGEIGIGLPTDSPEQLNFSSPKSISLQSGAGDLDLTCKLVVGSESNFSRQLLVDSISFESIEEHKEDEHPIVRNISTILSGTMFMESLEEQEYHFRAGEELHFESSIGEIRTIELINDHIAVTFHGTVSGMSSGAGNNRKSLMPTYLEWLKARHAVTLLWGSTIYIFGLILSIFRWWRTLL